MFKETLEELREFLNVRENKSKIMYSDHIVNWQISDGNKILLADDSGCELGHPTKESAYFLVLLGKDDEIYDGRITLIGNDITELKDINNSFGQIVLIKGSFNESNIHDRYIELDISKRSIFLDGYCFRARPSRGKEQIRVSKEAIKKGINFKTVGSAMIKKYKEKKYVDEVEIIFITDEVDIMALQPRTKKMLRYEDEIDRSIQNMMFNKYMESKEGQFDK